MLISVQAGNSDNKLPQSEWADFVRGLDAIIDAYEGQRHFFGGSPNYEKWQNVCFVFECDKDVLANLLIDLKRCREFYHQDSVCVLMGEAKFI